MKREEITATISATKASYIAIIIVVCIGSGWYRYKVNQGIKAYEAEMSKETYYPCSFVDEDGVQIEDYTEEESSKNEEHRGIKNMHIPFVRGFYVADGYGQSPCYPCIKAESKEQVAVCNDRYGYTKLDIVPEDLDKIKYSEDKTQNGY